MILIHKVIYRDLMMQKLHKIKIKGIQDEVFNDYKKTAMQIVFPYCDFKCDRENGCQMCQNSQLAHEPIIELWVKDIVERYLNNPITKAVVLGGLEPFDTPTELVKFVGEFRGYSKDDIVIYTGYTEEEIEDGSLPLQVTYGILCSYPNIYIKFGRFRPNQEPHYDEVLGIKLASDNQYGKKVSYEQ